MTLEEAVELVVYTFKNAHTGDIMVQKSPACTIEVLAQAVKNIFNSKAPIEIIGTRIGEKNYEHLISKEECTNVVDLGYCYRIPADMRTFNLDNNMPLITHVDENKFFEYINSNNSRLLTVKEVEAKLLSTPFIKSELETWDKKNVRA